MAVTTATVESMVLGLFERFRVRAGGRLSLDDLRAQWTTTHLRSTDLDVGLRELVFTGALHWIDTDEGLFLELSAEGDETLRQRAHIDGSTLRQLWGEIRLKWGRARGTEAPAAHTRRYTDALDSQS